MLSEPMSECYISECICVSMSECICVYDVCTTYGSECYLNICLNVHTNSECYLNVSECVISECYLKPLGDAGQQNRVSFET